MSNERIEGLGHQIKGTFKENVGRIIGDAKLTADGAAERAIGNSQNVEQPGGDRVGGIDTDRIVGVGHQLKGVIKKGLGRLIGDPSMVDDGNTEQAAGAAQNAVGSSRDEAREIQPPIKPGT
jgi:uncharacterized protein YjbJ (UPF0337 family)